MGENTYTSVALRVIPIRQSIQQNKYRADPARTKWLAKVSEVSKIPILGQISANTNIN